MPSTPRSIHLAAIALAGTLVAAAPAPAPPVLTGWSEYRSAHFTALADAAPRRTLDLLRRLERFRQVLSMLNKRLSVDAPVETLLVVFGDPETLVRFGPRFEGRAVEINGVFLSRPDGNLILTNGSSQTDPLPTVYHEYMHYFCANNFPPLPLWFNEGLAECYGTFRTDENSAEIGRVQEDHVASLRGSVLMPLQQLFSIGHRSRDYNEGDRRGVFYAQSWAITHYLLWDNPARKPQLGAFLDRLGAGRPPVEAFQEAFGTDLGPFMTELQQHIAQNRFHHTVMKFADQSFEKEVRTRAVTPAEAAARLAEVAIVFERSRAAEAEAVLAPALAADPVPAAAWRALGRVRDAQARGDEAIESFRKAIAADPADAVAPLLAGLALLERNDAASIAAARVTLRRGMQEHPAFAEMAIAFGRALTTVPGSIARTDLDFAIGRLEKALEQLPYRPDPAILLTELYAERGDLDRAEAFVRSVLPRLTDPGTLESLRLYVAARREQETARVAAAAAPAPDPGLPEDPPPLEPKAAAAPPSGGATPAPGTGSPPGRLPLPDEAEIKRLLATAPGRLREGEWDLVYNQAAALGNVRRYKEALALLDRLTPGCPFPYYKEQLVALRRLLARDGARAGAPAR